MILRELAALAEREKLVGDEAFEPKPIAWVINLDRKGRALGVERTGEAAKEGKRPEPVRMWVPRHPIRSSNVQPAFLCDKAEYVLGHAGTRKNEAKERVRAATYLKAYRELVEEAAKATRDPALSAILAFVDDESARRRCVGECGDDLASNDLFTFRLGGELLHEREALRGWWRSRVAAEKAAGKVGRCIVDGREGPLASLHNKLKNVRGSVSSGAPLVSFNNMSAFESYGLENEENAPVSASIMTSYTTALNRLLDEKWPDPEGGVLPSRRVVLSSSSVAVFWARGKNGVVDALAALFGGDEETVKLAFESVRSGKRTDMEDTSQFYALVLSGAQGRVAVKSFLVSTVRDVVRNLGRYWEDLAAPGVGEIPLPLWRLLRSLVPRGDLDRLPPDLGERLFEAALFGRSFPVSILDAAVRRCRTPEKNEGGDRMENVRIERAAIVRAYLRRDNDPRFHAEVRGPMNETSAREEVLGRLFAELQEMQYQALGDVNAGIERYFGAACATPQAVFPRLLKLSIHHFEKAQSGNSGAAYAVRQRIDEFCSAILGKGAKEAVREGHGRVQGFPQYLSLQEQGLFILGYHAQRHWNRERARAMAEKKRNENEKEKV